MRIVVRSALCCAMALSACFARGQVTEKVLYSFGAPPDVESGGPALVSDSAGNLYGIATGGGSQGGGGVFELSPTLDGTWTETVLYSFCPFDFTCTTGVTPTGLTIDSNGNLFGSTVVGSSFFPGGVVFELSPPSVTGGQWNYSVIYNFCSLSSCADGQHPQGSPTLDSSGNIYGVTDFGGQFQSGVVWELSPNLGGGWTETVLYSFCSLENCADGSFPESGLVWDKSGNLYGTTLDGGTGRHDRGDNTGGTLYELSRGTSGWTERVVENFPFTAGSLGPASIDPWGNVYTTISAVSSDNPPFDGVVARTNPTRGLQVFYFNGTDGSNPLFGVIIDAKRKMLYGTVENGRVGASCGGVFQITALGQESQIYAFCQYASDAGAPGGLIEDAAGNLYGSTVSGGTYGAGAVFEITP
jgi:uncharacterized repeat protein (TIGR03803 family)